MKIQLTHTFHDIISLKNLLLAWTEFSRGKGHKHDVQEFHFRLFDNLSQLHDDLANKNYAHGPYQFFKIADPKPRDIHKATVRDRVLHHALYRMLYPFFDKTFIADSFSCRVGKGTHRALNRFRSFAYRASQNHTKTIWVLKCDIKKCFASINHKILLNILAAYIPDENITWLLERVMGSFSGLQVGVGLPLGNLTSQLFVNIYLNILDQLVKHELCINYYMRYADDFVFLSPDRELLLALVPRIRLFLCDELCLTLHPRKIELRTLTSGVDFLGWVHFPDHRVLRTTTRNRMFRRIQESNGKFEVVESYFGLMGHGNSRALEDAVEQWIYGGELSCK